MFFVVVFFPCKLTVWLSALLFHQVQRGGCANIFCWSTKLVSPLSLIWRLLLLLNWLAGGEHTQVGFFLRCRKIPAVFTESSSLLEVEVLICCFQHEWGTEKDMLFLSSFVCLFWDFYHLSCHVATVADPLSVTPSLYSEHRIWS